LAKTTVGNNHIKDFVPVGLYAEPQTIQIDLWSHKPRTHLGPMSLAQAIQEHGGPGKLLLPFGEVKKDEGCPHPYTFKQMNLGRTTSKVRSTEPKSFHFSAKARISYFEHCMGKVWRFLQDGSTVEIQVYRKGFKSSSPENFSKILNETIHMRPDVILAAMPAGSGIIVDPQTNFVLSAWVMGSPKNKEGEIVKPENITRRFDVRRREVLTELEKLRYNDLEETEWSEEIQRE
jgi:hypothetical protein